MATGLVLEGFSEIELIRTGGFSSIYRAREESTGRLVALKVVDAGGVPELSRQAWRREVGALGALSSHPNILTLHQAIEHGDRLLLVLELCVESAADVLRRSGALPISLALSYGIKVAGALETAHLADMLHRDLKPQNILLTRFDEPVLADFGIARLQASSAAYTATGLQAFTAAHAAPEVLAGERVSVASDVYGLASTLYTMLSAEAPFAPSPEESPLATMLRITRDDPPVLGRADAPPLLKDLLAQAMARSPRDRPASALAFARRLMAVEAALSLPPTEPRVGRERVDPSSDLETTVPRSRLARLTSNLEGAEAQPSPGDEEVCVEAGDVQDAELPLSGTCGAVVRLTRPLRRHLQLLLNGAESDTRRVACELRQRHGGDHAGLLRVDVEGNRDLWCLWSPTEAHGGRILWLEYCEARRLGQPDDECVLYSGHSGDHSSGTDWWPASSEALTADGHKVAGEDEPLNGRVRWQIIVYAPQQAEVSFTITGTEQDAEEASREAVETASGTECRRTDFGWATPTGDFASVWEQR